MELADFLELTFCVHRGMSISLSNVLPSGGDPRRGEEVDGNKILLSLSPPFSPSRRRRRTGRRKEGLFGSPPSPPRFGMALQSREKKIWRPFGNLWCLLSSTSVLCEVIPRLYGPCVIRSYSPLGAFLAFRRSGMASVHHVLPSKMRISKLRPKMAGRNGGVSPLLFSGQAHC